ncbi:MAG: autotransporter outer membrane beta-barrel domain-containing protein [Dichotomicrobium sp.]
MMRAIPGRSFAPRMAVAAAGLLASFVFGAPALHAAGACGDGQGGIVTTCPDWLSQAQQQILQQRRDRAMAPGPETDQMSARLDGRAFDPAANGAAPLLVAPAGDAALVRSSLSQWSAYFARRDAERIEELGEVEEFAPDDLELPPLAATQNRKFDVWSSAKIEGLGSDAASNGYTSHVGADYAVDDGLLVGASVELEELENEAGVWAGATAASTSYLVGPYVATRLSDNLMLDSRVAWGRGSDAIGSDGASSDFATERSLAKARLRGDFHVEGWAVSSAAAFTYVEEAAAGATGTTVVTRDLSLGPEIRRSFRLEEGQVIEPFLRYNGTVDLDAVEDLSQLDDLAVGGSVGGGVTVTKPDDYTIQATTEVDGVEAETDPNVTSRLKLTVPLN